MIRDPVGAAQSDDDASDELGDESGSDEHPVGDDEQAASPACIGEHSAQTILDQQLNQFETPLGLDSAASPDFVQHVAALKAKLDLVHDAVKKFAARRNPMQHSLFTMTLLALPTPPRPQLKKNAFVL